MIDYKTIVDLANEVHRKTMEMEHYIPIHNLEKMLGEGYAQNEIEKALRLMGYQHGVYDCDRNELTTLAEAKLGSLYLGGYKKGVEDARIRKWYVVSVDVNNIPKCWYIDGEINGWSNTKEEATAFQTEAEARKHCDSLSRSYGRVNYSVRWVKV